MKYVVILGDGMADLPIEKIGNKTPLMVANKPNIDALRKGWLARTDEYGIGLQFIMEHCPEDPYKYIRDNQGR